MSPRRYVFPPSVPAALRQGGFALVATLSLMVLLTLLALGLLTLSARTIALATAQADIEEARAAARLSLALAINQLQMQTGPDQRITAPADQLPASSTGESTAALPEQRFWTGVYDSWPAGADNRPSPSFRSWLVSNISQAKPTTDLAKQSATGPTIELVGAGSTGDANLRVTAPMFSQSLPRGGTLHYAWWTGDEGIKALVSTPPTQPPSTGNPTAVRMALQTSPRNAIELTHAGATLPFSKLDPANSHIPTAVTRSETSLLADKPDTTRPLFHDLTGCSSGLLTDVRNGGFRKDLSLYLERDATSHPKDILFTCNGTDGANMEELWNYHNLWKQLTSGRVNYTTGGSSASGGVYLKTPESMAAVQDDPSFMYKQLTYASYQTILSFHSRRVGTDSTGAGKYRLYIVCDPVVTIWNPLDVPVVLNPDTSMTAWNSIKFWQLPYDFTITMGGTTRTFSFRDLIGSEWHYLTLRVGFKQPVVLKPGEVLLYSEAAGTPITVSTAGGGLDFVNGAAGWNYGGGEEYAAGSGGAYVEGGAGSSFTYHVEPNRQASSGSRDWALTMNNIFYKEDRTGGPLGINETLGIGGVFIDWVDGKPTSRILAADFPDFFGKIPDSSTRPYTLGEISDDVGRSKAPFMLYTYAAKTEQDSLKRARFLARFNPKATHTDFQTLQPDELDTLPYEIQIRPLSSWKDRLIEVSPTGKGYFGGGYSAATGTSTIITHSVPREAPISLASFQNAFVNGFSSLYTTGNEKLVGTASFLGPQVIHPVGNSWAPSVMPKDKIRHQMGNGDPLADHSYLINNALWDSWFLSGFSPQTSTGFAKRRTQQAVIADAFDADGDGASTPGPHSRYLPSVTGAAAAPLVARWITGTTPSANAHAEIGSYLRVAGMFNVNSTSVEAWRTLLASMRKAPVAAQSAAAATTVKSQDGISVPGILNPTDQQIQSADASLADPVATPGWSGFRTLTDDEITNLATTIVKEVRKRGPFLSLADFINRRPGNDINLAKSGPLQTALDDPKSGVNKTFVTGSRSISMADVTNKDRGFAFPDAEAGPAAAGIPGCVKQADLLTSIGPILSARSDTFTIRAYGDKTDASGKIIARAWCEAVVQRDAEFVDPKDLQYASPSQLGAVNKTFGRRYRIVSFKWLQPGEV